MSELRQNTWETDRLYDQVVAGNINYTGAPNQRLGGTGTDPTGTYGYSAWQSTLDRALGRA